MDLITYIFVVEINNSRGMGFNAGGQLKICISLSLTGN